MDTELGSLERVGRFWQGMIALPHHGSVPVRLSGTRTAPDPVSLALARELPRRLPALIPAIEKALFEHYEPYREAADPLRGLDTPPEVWQHVTPRFVTIEPLSGVPTVELAYETRWDVEHTVAARFQDWALRELCGSV